jgi:hypothetical protein
MHPQAFQRDRIVEQIRTFFLPQDNVMTAEAHWEKILDALSLRRLLRDGHRTEATTSLLKQLEEDV